MDVNAIKGWWEYRDPFYYSADAERNVDWLIAEVERLADEQRKTLAEFFNYTHETSKLRDELNDTQGERDRYKAALKEIAKSYQDVNTQGIAVLRGVAREALEGGVKAVLP